MKTKVYQLKLILNKFNYDNFLFNLSINKTLEIFIEEENKFKIQLYPIMYREKIFYTVFILDETYKEKLKDNCFVYKLKNRLISIEDENVNYKIYQLEDITNDTLKNLTIEIFGFEINKKYELFPKYMVITIYFIMIFYILDIEFSRTNLLNQILQIIICYMKKKIFI